MKLECPMPPDTSIDGRPSVSVQTAISLFADIAADNIVHGTITDHNRKIMQRFCDSAHGAGLLDVQVFEKVMELAQLSDVSLCDTCKYHR